jgi:hypothetical protein
VTQKAVRSFSSFTCTPGGRRQKRGCPERRAGTHLVIHHQWQPQRVRTRTLQRHAHHAGGVAHHEGHRLRGYFVGCANQVAFVLPVLVVHHNHKLAACDSLQRHRDAGEAGRGLTVVQRLDHTAFRLRLPAQCCRHRRPPTAAGRRQPQRRTARRQGRGAAGGRGQGAAQRATGTHAGRGGGGCCGHRPGLAAHGVVSSPRGTRECSTGRRTPHRDQPRKSRARRLWSSSRAVVRPTYERAKQQPVEPRACAVRAGVEPVVGMLGAGNTRQVRVSARQLRVIISVSQSRISRTQTLLAWAAAGAMAYALWVRPKAK